MTLLPHFNLKILNKMFNEHIAKKELKNRGIIMVKFECSKIKNGEVIPKTEKK
jgi:hypothetical protein